MTHLIPSDGERIRLIEMPNDPCPIEPGSLGTITYVSPGPGQIGVKWDSGRTLHLVIGVDVFEVVTPHRVFLIEDNSYARYDVFVEATGPDQAAGIAREMVVDGKADGGTQHFRDDALQRGNQDETSASIKVRGTAGLMTQGGWSPTGGIRSASA